jgi:hypothetical protein
METCYYLIDKFDYKDGVFGAGIVKNSIHPSDKVFLQINGNIFELRDDEIYAIISALSKSLWCNYQFRKQDKIKLKWQTKEQLDRLWDRKIGRVKIDRKKGR